MATVQNDNFNIRAPKAIDNRYGVFENGVWRAFNDTAEALSLITYRYVGLTCLVKKAGLNVEYWFKDNTTALIEKQAASSSYTFENGLRESGGVVKLGLDLATLGTTNKGVVTEEMYLVSGDVSLSNFMGFLISLDSDQAGMISAISTGNTAAIAVDRLSGGTVPSISIEKTYNGQIQGLNFGDNIDLNKIILSDNINQKGLEEAADYSANKTQYSYVTKKMLDEAPIRPSKTISTTTYTFISGDEKRWLIFTNAAGCTITIPNLVFADGKGLQGVQRGAGQLTFTAGSGVTLNKSSLVNAKTATTNSVFGIQFESASICTLFGELELVV